MKTEFYRDAELRMQKSLEALRGELAKIRTGKATASLLDGIKIDYYGNQTPLRQVANVTVPELRLLSIQPYDKSMVSEIERAIMKSDLGLNPTNDGKVVRVPIPPLTEERRKDLVRLIKKMGEDDRVAIRNIRRDVNEHLKKVEKESEITEDEMHHELDQIQELTNEYIKKVEEVLQMKEQEIMEV